MNTIKPSAISHQPSAEVTGNHFLPFSLSPFLAVSAIVLTSIFTVNVALAESPLSSLGYGLPSSSAGVRAAGMGGASLGVVDTLGLNLLAPALWSGGSEARLGFFGNYSSNSVTDTTGSSSSDYAGVSGVVAAFPLGHGSFFGITLSPLTRMDYRRRSAETGNWTPTLITEHGRGGLSQGLVAISIPARDDLRLGVAARVIFGTLNRFHGVEFPNLSASDANSASLEVQRRLSGFGYGLSAQWRVNPDWILGGRLDSPVRADAQDDRIVRSGGGITSDVTSDLTERFDLPLSVALGVGRSFGRHLTTAELAWENWGAASQPADLAKRMRDALKLSAGWEWAPEYRPFDPWWRELIYRAGAYSQTDYALSPMGHQPRRTAVTAGLSIPYFSGKSRMDVAFEIGWRGDKTKDLVGERDFAIHLGFSHKEPWFVSRKEAQEP